MKKTKKQIVRANKKRKNDKQKQTFKQYEKECNKKGHKSGKLPSWESYDVDELRVRFNGGVSVSDAIEEMSK